MGASLRQTILTGGARYSYAPMGNTLAMQVSDGPRSVRTRPHFYANNGDTCRAAALDHQGIVLQPDFLIGMDLAAA